MLSCSKTANGDLKYTHALQVLGIQTTYMCVCVYFPPYSDDTYFTEGFLPSFCCARKHRANVKRIHTRFVILERLIVLFIDETVKQKPSAWPFRVTVVIATSVEPWPVMNYCLWCWECWQLNHSTVSIENSIYLKRWYCFPSKWQPWQMGRKQRRRLNKEIEREPAGSWASCSQPRMMNRVWLCLTGSNITIHSPRNTWSTLY